MSEWFGEPWPAPDYRAPVCDDDQLRVATPVGVPCMHCDEPIADGDQGTIMRGYLGLGDDGRAVHVEKLLPAHVECGLRSVLGCFGNLTGQGHTHDGSYRDDARKVQTWIETHGR